MKSRFLMAMLTIVTVLLMGSIIATKAQSQAQTLCRPAQVGEEFPTGVKILKITSEGKEVEALNQDHSYKNWDITLQDGTLFSSWGPYYFNDLVHGFVFWINRNAFMVCATPVSDGVELEGTYKATIGTRIPGGLVIVQSGATVDDFGDPVNRVVMVRESAQTQPTPVFIAKIGELPKPNYDPDLNRRYNLEFPRTGIGEFFVLGNHLYTLTDENHLSVTEYGTPPPIKLAYINRRYNVVIGDKEFFVPNGARYAHQGNGKYFAITNQRGKLLIYNRQGLANEIDKFGWPTDLQLIGEELAVVNYTNSIWWDEGNIAHISVINVITEEVFATWPILEFDGSVPEFNSCHSRMVDSEYLYYLCGWWHEGQTVWNARILVKLRLNLKTGVREMVPAIPMPDNSQVADRVPGKGNFGEVIKIKGGWVVQSQDSVWFAPDQGNPVPLVGTDQLGWWDFIGVVE